MRYVQKPDVASLCNFINVVIIRNLVANFFWQKRHQHIKEMTKNEEKPEFHARRVHLKRVWADLRFNHICSFSGKSTYLKNIYNRSKINLPSFVRVYGSISQELTNIFPWNFENFFCCLPFCQFPILATRWRSLSLLVFVVT
jgi:hypothetical protein